MFFERKIYLITADKHSDGTTTFNKEELSGRVINTEGLSKLVDDCGDTVYINDSDEGLYRQFIESKLGMRPFRDKHKQRKINQLESELSPQNWELNADRHYAAAMEHYKQATEYFEQAESISAIREEKQNELDRLLDEIEKEEAREFKRLFGEG